MRVAEVTYLDVPEEAVALVPVGSLEQHGPHLPLGTDIFIAQWVAEAVERDFPDKVLLYPAIPITCSLEHGGFRGTTYVGYTTMFKYLLDIVKSMARWRPLGIVFVNGHGGNVEVMNLVVKEWNYKWGRPKVTHYYVYNKFVLGKIKELFPHFGHADSVETSLVAAINQGLVRMGRLHRIEARGNINDTRVVEISQSGVVGLLDPSTVDPGKGAEVLRAMVNALVAELRAQYPHVFK